MTGCASTEEDILAAIEVCKDNGGIELYKANHGVLCMNGIKTDDPKMYVNFLKHKKEQ